MRTAVVKREQKNMGPRPKSVDFEVLHVQIKQPNSAALELNTSNQLFAQVLQSVENICRAQPLAYSAGVVVQGTRASQRRTARL